MLLTLCLPACVKKRLNEQPEVPPNTQIYYYPKRLVWTNLIQIIRNELLIPFDYASPTKGQFVTQEVRSGDDPSIKMKVRISGAMTYDGDGQVVSIYKDAKVWDEENKVWKSQPTDYILETSILKRLADRLSRYKRK